MQKALSRFRLRRFLSNYLARWLTSEVGPFSDFGGRNRDVRFPPVSDQITDIARRLKRTNCGNSPPLFDHFGGAGKQSLRDREAQGLGGGQVFETCAEPAARYFTRQQ